MSDWKGKIYTNRIEDRSEIEFMALPINFVLD